MLDTDLRQQLAQVFEHVSRTVASCERAIELVRTSGHDELLEPLERIRDGSLEHSHGLRDLLGESTVLRSEEPQRSAADQDEAPAEAARRRSREFDIVDEASKESFPASDPPAY